MDRFQPAEPVNGAPGVLAGARVFAPAFVADSVDHGWGRLVSVATAQHGVVTARQALEICGLNRRSFERKTAREGWTRPWRGVYVLPGVVLAGRTRLKAGVLAMGEWAAVSQHSAVGLYGLLHPRDAESFEQHTDEVCITLPWHFRSRAKPGLRLFRTRTWEEGDVRNIDGIAVVSPMRLLMDLAGVWEVDQLQAVAIEFNARRLIRKGYVFSRMDRTGPIPGRDRLDAVFSDSMTWGVESGFERSVLQRLQRAGLRFVSQIEVDLGVAGRRRLDLANRERRLAVECDGRMAHTSVEAFEDDRRRQNALVAAGWTILRIDYARWCREPDAFVEEVASAYSSLRAGAVERARLHPEQF